MMMVEGRMARRGSFGPRLDTAGARVLAVVTGTLTPHRAAGSLFGGRMLAIADVVGVGAVAVVARAVCLRVNVDKSVMHLGSRPIDGPGLSRPKSRD